MRRKSFRWIGVPTGFGYRHCCGQWPLAVSLYLRQFCLIVLTDPIPDESTITAHAGFVPELVDEMPLGLAGRCGEDVPASRLAMDSTVAGPTSLPDRRRLVSGRGGRSAPLGLHPERAPSGTPNFARVRRAVLGEGNPSVLGALWVAAGSLSMPFGGVSHG